jgi:hypothetical protein
LVNRPVKEKGDKRNDQGKTQKDKENAQQYLLLFV